MSGNELIELVERMRYYEQHQHCDGYEITLDEFRREQEARPIGMALAILAVSRQTLPRSCR